MQKLKIVSFGMMLPAKGIGNAGGEFYADHVGALRELGHEVRVVVPPLGPSESAAKNSAATETLVLQTSYQHLGGALRLLNNLLPGAVRPAYRREVRASAVLRDWLHDADVVEYQWAEFASLARTAERIRGRPGPSYAVLHDEVVQREWRRFRKSYGPRRILRSLSVVFAFLQERRFLNGVRHVLVLSEKDATRCKKIVPTSLPYVIRPPVVDDRGVIAAEGGGRAVLFVGAMSRPENVHAVSWFCSSVWPMIQQVNPALHFMIAGANPTAEVLALAGPNVKVTGFVADLDAVYAQARVVVVPMFFGAGVKFKTLTALGHALPVVSTPTGAEGIYEGESGIFHAIETAPSRFGSAVLAAVESEALHSGRMEVAQRVRKDYGVKSYTDRVHEFYSRIIPVDLGRLH